VSLLPLLRAQRFDRVQLGRTARRQHASEQPDDNGNALGQQHKGEGRVHRQGRDRQVNHRHPTLMSISALIGDRAKRRLAGLGVLPKPQVSKRIEGASKMRYFASSG